jgi:hypothetical protein
MVKEGFDSLDAARAARMRRAMDPVDGGLQIGRK